MSLVGQLPPSVPAACLGADMFRVLKFDGASLRRAVGCLCCSTTHVCRRSIGRLLGLFQASACFFVLRKAQGV